MALYSIYTNTSLQDIISNKCMYIHTHIPGLEAAASLSFKFSDPINLSKQPLSDVFSATPGCKIWRISCKFGAYTGILWLFETFVLQTIPMLNWKN